MSAPLKIVFFGTPEFAVPTLAALLASRHPVAGVITQPDRPRGRGQQSSFSPVKALAVERELPLLQPTRMKDPAFLDAFAALGADLGVVAAYGRILPRAVIETPRLGLINVHASLLPRYRGAAPIQRAVLAGDAETGVTIMRIVEELDAGAMFDRVVVPIGPDATSVEVERELARVGAALLVQVVDRIADGTAREEPQDAAAATYAPKITREEGVIAWDRPARAIHNQVRGLTPWPHAWCHLQDTRVIVTRTRPLDEDTAAAPGTVLEARGDVIRVATGSGVLRILELQPEGKRPLSAREFLAGRSIPEGIRLT